MNSELMEKLESLLNKFQERALSLREEYASITSIDNDLTKEDISKIKDITKRIDEKSFIVIANAREVLGKGFKEK